MKKIWASSAGVQQVRVEENPTSRYLFSLFLVLLITSIALFGLSYLSLPHLRRALIREDSFTENFTLYLFLQGVIVCFFHLFRRAARPKGYVAIGAFAGLCVLEEISYGQRLFPSLTFPKLANGATFDALSDLNRVMTITLGRVGVPWEGVVLLALLGVAALAYRFRERFSSVRLGDSWSYLIVAVLFLVGATFIDSYINPLPRFVLLEEVFEFSAALAVLFAAFAGPLVKR